jgi:hypothetical protein
MSAVILPFPSAPRGEGWEAVVHAVTCAVQRSVAAGQGRAVALRAARRTSFGFRVGLCERWLVEIVDAEIAARSRQ